jgi:hypothetical protein
MVILISGITGVVDTAGSTFLLGVFLFYLSLRRVNGILQKEQKYDMFKLLLSASFIKTRLQKSQLKTVLVLYDNNAFKDCSLDFIIARTLIAQLRLLLDFGQWSIRMEFPPVSI